MAKQIKVHELAKEYNVTSKEMINLLSKLGEDVSSASSVIPAPVLRSVRKELGDPPKLETTSDEKTQATKKKPTLQSNDKSKVRHDAQSDSQSGESSQAKIPSPENQISEGGTPVESSVNQVPKPEAPVVFTASPEDSVKQNPAVPLPSYQPQVKPQELTTPQSATDGMTNIPKPKMHRFNPTANTPRNGGRRQNGEHGNWQNGVRKGGNSPYSASRTGGNSPYGGARPTGQRQVPGGNKPSGARGGGTLIKPGQLPPQALRAGGATQKPADRGNKFGAGNTQGKPGGPNKGNWNLRRGQKAGAFGGVKTGKSRYAEPKNKEQEMEYREIHGFKVPKGDGQQVVRLKQGATLNEFADKIFANASDLAGILFKEFSQMVTINQSVDEETLQLLAVDLGYQLEIVTEEELDRELLEEFNIDLNAEEVAEADLEPRPPVVTVMGHVDHGKTRLLDAIRNTNVIEGEAGGITQRIGAYQIHLDHEGVDRKITFIDTPGHEAFTAMRARGAEITDVAILVVAADDGVMPQTVEAINHAQSAGVPIVVAVNKIDKEGANPEKVRGQLTEFDLIPEEYGGQTMFVDISAKEGKGIQDLLDAVLLTVDAALDLKANPKMAARGNVIEARLDKGRGPVMSVLIETGTIRIGDPIVAGRSYGRVRAMYNEHGRKLKEAYPSCPVRIIGMQSVPTAGDSFIATDDDRTSRQIAEAREAAYRAALLAKRSKRMTLEALKDAVADGRVDRLNLIIKGDTSGSVEALEDSLLKLEEQAELNNEVGLNVVHRGVGDITQNDVNLATVDNAVIVAFNVKTAGMAGDLADAEGVNIRYYNVIYQVMEDIELSLHGMLKPEYEEEMIGYAEVREIFKSSKAGTIAGCMVKGGVIKRNAIAKIMRGDELLQEGLKIDNLKRFKDDAKEVKEGFECGISFDSFDELQTDDIIECYELVEKKRELPKVSQKSTE